MTLQPAAAVRFAAADKSPRDAHAGLLRLRVADTYSVSLSGPAWVDIVSSGKLVR